MAPPWQHLQGVGPFSQLPENEENPCLLTLPEIPPRRSRAMLGWGSTFNLKSGKPVNNFTLFLSKKMSKSWSQPDGLTVFLLQFFIPNLRSMVLGILIKTQHLRTAFRTKCQPSRKEMNKTVRRLVTLLRRHARFYDTCEPRCYL